MEPSSARRRAVGGGAGGAPKAPQPATRRAPRIGDKRTVRHAWRTRAPPSGRMGSKDDDIEACGRKLSRGLE
ncbi:hypothetical protein NDU88_006522 [Pleurodeles waltl]|uniref:Uncharacterized protein n=1 Tax=Pleurodeles waltl TaxID=8319 RepID=A0AAV7N4A1_PLEWA|nr:hypothetical protein NDU88_006522 [Pleurodeles waltl]